jgi:hypothetical protein
VAEVPINVSETEFAKLFERRQGFVRSRLRKDRKGQPVGQAGPLIQGCWVSHRIPWHPVEDPLDTPLQIGEVS